VPISAQSTTVDRVLTEVEIPIRIVSSVIFRRQRPSASHEMRRTRPIMEREALPKRDPILETRLLYTTLLADLPLTRGEMWFGIEIVVLIPSDAVVENATFPDDDTDEFGKVLIDEKGIHGSVAE